MNNLQASLYIGFPLQRIIGTYGFYVCEEFLWQLIKKYRVILKENMDAQ